MVQTCSSERIHCMTYFVWLSVSIHELPEFVYDVC